MKTIRKLLALSLSALLLLTTLPLTAFADEGSFNFTFDTVWLDSDIIEVAVGFNTNLYLGGGAFYIVYPSDALELILPEVEEGKNPLYNYSSLPGHVISDQGALVSVGFVTMEYITGEKEICALPFRVKDSTTQYATFDIYTDDLVVVDPEDPTQSESFSGYISPCCPDVYLIHTHTYDNRCDTDCNICDDVREANHTYDSQCDTDCNACGEVREADHTYSNACDNYCNVCWKIREAPPHTYGTDNLCTVCNYPRPVEDYFIYEIEDGKATITAVDKSIGKDIKIPDRLDGVPVTRIGPNAFEGCTALRSIILLNGVTNIDANAFSNCTSLLWVAIPDSVTQIDSNAFSGCTALADVYYSGNEAARTAIALADDGNTPLLNATWHYIDAAKKTFMFVSETTWVESDIVEVTIGYDSDLYLTNGEFEISFPTDTLELLDWSGRDLFEINDDNKHEGDLYAGFIDVDYLIGKASFCTLSFRVKDLTQKDAGVDIHIQLLNHLPDPKDLWSYGDYRDYTGGSNFHIYVDLTHTHVYDNDCDSDCNICGSIRVARHVCGNDNLCDICGEDKYLSCYTYSVEDDEATITGVNTGISGDIVLPATLGGYPVTSIGDEAFYGCNSLTTMRIPNSVTSIASEAFYLCDSLTLVTIPDSVTRLGARAFAYCDSLATVTVPNSVTSIGDFAFAGCTSLTTMTIPDSVTSIGCGVFTEGVSLTALTVSEGNTVYHSAGNCIIHTVNKELIAGCQTSVIPADGSVTSIGRSAFDSCYTLTSVTIPDSVMNIDEGAFYDCDSLTTVTIPSGVTSIGDHAFQLCDLLTSVTISNSVTSIGDYAFDYCNSLTDVYYDGSEADRKNITIADYNKPLLDATWHYGKAEEPLLILGNADGNDKLDSTDARLVLQYTVKKIDGTTLNLTAADVDGSGKVDSTDARLILQYVVKKIDTFPAA